MVVTMVKNCDRLLVAMLSADELSNVPADHAIAENARPRAASAYRWTVAKKADFLPDSSISRDPDRNAALPLIGPGQTEPRNLDRRTAVHHDLDPIGLGARSCGWIDDV
jgi:hypothetical protein